MTCLILCLFHPVRFLKSPFYEGELADYVKSFAEHRQRIQFEISLFTKLGIDKANESLVYLTRVSENVNANVLALFRKLDTPQEKDVRKFVTENGGADKV